MVRFPPDQSNICKFENMFVRSEYDVKTKSTSRWRALNRCCDGALRREN